MVANYNILFEPINIGTMSLKNRIVMAPMVTRYAGADGKVTSRMLQYYRERACGGSSGIVVEATYPATGGHPSRLYLFDDSFIPGLRQLATTIKEAGARAIIQLNPGRGREDEARPVSASVVKSAFSDKVAKALDVSEIKQLIKEFGEGAYRAAEAGFESIQIHGASGYLIAQFLSPLTNKRKDLYGGSLENRARFAVELLEETKKVLGKGYPIIVRFSVDEYVDGGYDISETIVVSKWLEKAGMDCLDVITGSASSFEYVIPPMSFARGFNTDVSARFKKVLGVPIMVAGRLNTPEVLLQTIKEAKADIVALGRPLLADPEFPAKLKQGKEEDIRKCVGCDQGCCDRLLLKGTSPLSCTVNSRAGREEENRLKVDSRIGKTKKIVVIGGGIAGLEFSRLAAHKGHSVILYEKSNRLGGNLWAASGVSFKREFRLELDFQMVQLKKSNVEVKLNFECNEAELKKQEPDIIVVATGSKPRLPAVNGIDLPHVFDAGKVLAEEVHLNGKIAVVGDGMVAIETAIMLKEQGAKQVTLLTKCNNQADIAKDMQYLIRKWMFEKYWVGHEISVKYGSQLREVVQDGIMIERGDVIRKECFDYVVVAWNRERNRELIATFQGIASEIYEIGDCVKCPPINLDDTIHKAAEIAAVL